MTSRSSCWFIVPALTLVVGCNATPEGAPGVAEATPAPVPSPIAHVPSMLPGGAEAWDLFWSDEFNGDDAAVDAAWVSQNSPSNHILSSRWRENVVIGDGTLKLVNRKEERGGQSWTSGSIWTKQQFLYGYYECRYRYAAAEGTNNSFWLMPVGELPPGGVKWEIDVNEGHYPNEVNTNVHNHSAVTVVDGKKRHPQTPKAFQFGARPDVRVQFETPITTKRIRISSRHGQHIHIDQFRAFAVNPAGYPDPLSSAAGQVDYAREAGVAITTSGFLKTEDTSPTIIDGIQGTYWVSQREGEKWMEITLAGERTIGCLQFINGWQVAQGEWNNLMDEFRLEYEVNGAWVTASAFSILDGAFFFARDYQVVGLDWTEKELVFYLNGKEIRRLPNEFCHNPGPVWLSLAVIPWAGRVSDAIHGTQMEVDYVRVFRRRVAPNHESTPDAAFALLTH